MKTALAALFAAFALGFASADDDKKDSKPKTEDKKKDDKKKDDKKGMTFTGTWTRDTEAGVTLTFTFKSKTELTVKAVAGDAEMIGTCKYTIEKDKADKSDKDKPEKDKDTKDKDAKADVVVKGVVKAEITKVETKNDFPMAPEKGYKMRFKFTVAKDKKSAKLTDFEADNAEQVKDIIEGEYKPKKAD